MFVAMGRMVVLVLTPNLGNPAPPEDKTVEVVPLPVAQQPGGLGIEFSLFGTSQFSLFYRVATLGKERDAMYELWFSGAAVSLRRYVHESETEYARTWSVRNLLDKNSKEVGKLVSVYLGTSFSCELGLPVGLKSRDSRQKLRWYPIQGVSFSVGLRNFLPSLDMGINF